MKPRYRIIFNIYTWYIPLNIEAILFAADSGFELSELKTGNGIEYGFTFWE